MNFLRATSRVIIGIIFILSGFLKAIDPIGGALKIREYLIAFNFDFLEFLSLPIGVLLSSIEFIIGVAVLKGLRMRLFSMLAFWFMLFFTMLTLYSALFSPVDDCGCFGEAIKLSNWATFYKNVVLMVAATIVFVQRKKFRLIAPVKIEWAFTIFYSLLILTLSIYSLIRLPQIDFGGFKPGTDIVENSQGVEKVFETTLIYSKDGKEEEFTIENLPDTTWTYVDTKVEEITKGADDDYVDFALKDVNGEYVGNEFLASSKSLFIVSFYNSNRIDSATINGVIKLNEEIISNGGELYILSGDGVESTFLAMNSLLDTGIKPLFTDYKSVVTFNRSNGGLTYLSKGIVIAKWSKFNYPHSDLSSIINKDPYVEMISQRIKESLFLEIFLAGLLIFIAINRYFLRLRKNPKFLSRREESAKIDSIDKE